MARPARSEQPVAEWKPGAVVGRYSLLAKIATGGMFKAGINRQATS